MPRKVPIKNIFYMLSYVWDDVKLMKQGNVGADDDFKAEHFYVDLFLIYAERYIKRGVISEYVEAQEIIAGIKGKVDFKKSLETLAFENAHAACEFDEYSSNIRLNQVIKTTAFNLYRSKIVDRQRKKRLHQIMIHFGQIDLIKIKNQDFKFSFNRFSIYSEKLIEVCELIFRQMMISSSGEVVTFYHILDNENEFAKLFEKFLYKFYLKHSKFITTFQKNQTWNFLQLDEWLPKMQLDVCVESDDCVWIMDAKYYSRFYGIRDFYQSDTKKLISGNLYQIHSYLMNYQSSKILHGVLIYPKPFSNEEISKTYTFKQDNRQNTISVNTIDLEKNWQEIESSLMAIIS